MPLAFIAMLFAKLDREGLQETEGDIHRLEVL